MHWKVWTLLATLSWTLWGAGVKLALNRIDWMRLDVLSALAALGLIAIFAPAGYKLRPDSAHLIGLLVGGLGAAGGIFFYIALSKGPVSIIIPITSLYVVGVAIIGVMALGEPLTWRKGLGIICAGAAIFLIAGES